MSLLHEETLARLDNAARASVDRFTEGLRTALWQGESIPMGYVRGEPDLMSKHLARQANREQMGTTPGDVNSTVIQHPAVQEMMAQQMQPEVPQIPEGAA